MDVGYLLGGPPVMATIKKNKGHIRVVLFSYSTTIITGEGGSSKVLRIDLEVLGCC